MKKFLVLFLVSTVLLGVVGCANNGYSPQNTSTNQQPNDTANNSSEEKEEIVLTTENILSYLVMDISVLEVVQDIDNGLHESKDADIEINIYPKTRGDFENVSLIIQIDSASESWQTKGEYMLADRKISLTIPIDGKINKTLKMNSQIVDQHTYIASNPVFNIKVVSVTGSFIK